MIRKTFLTFCILLTAMTLVGFRNCDSYDREVEKNLASFAVGIPKTSYQNRKYKYTTPAGNRIESVVPVPATAMTAVDYGVQRRIERFQIIFPNWQPVPKARILFIHPNSAQTQQPDGTWLPTGPCKLESIPGAPCLYVFGIKTAGTVLGTHSLWDKIDLDPPIVLPHQGEGNWQWLEYLSAATHNEDEHRAGYLNITRQPTDIFNYFLGERDVHPWCWGEPCPPYQEGFAKGGFVMPDEVKHCLPNPTKKEIDKLINQGLTGP
jgi:hypothetical protein